MKLLQKRIAVLIIVWGSWLIGPASHAQSITLTTPALNTNAVCYGGQFHIGYTLTGFAATVPVDILLSDANGSFANPFWRTQLPRANGTYTELLSFEPYKDVLPPGTDYRFKLCVDNVCNSPSEAFAIAPENNTPITVKSDYRVSQLNLSSGTVCPDRPTRFEVKNWQQAALQWYRNGVALPGETSNVLSTTQAGTFTVRASKGGCATTEEIASLQAGSATPEAVNISGSTTINQNQTATFTLTRPSPTSALLRVYLSDYTDSEQFPIALFGTSTTKTIQVKPGKTTSYFVTKVSTACGYKTNTGSGTATVTVNTGGNDLRIAAGALPSTTFCAGEYVTVPYSTTDTFQNQNGSYNFRVAITDETGQYDKIVDRFLDTGGVQFRIPDDMYGTGHRLRVISTSPYVASAYSVPFTIRQSIVNARIFIEPDRVPALCASTGINSVKLTARVAPYEEVGYSQGGLTYQWYKVGVAITGATSSTYSATERGYYWVEISNGCTTRIVDISIYGPESSPQLVLTGRNPICEAEIKYFDRPYIAVPNYYSPDALYTWTRNGVIYSKGVVPNNGSERRVNPLEPTESGEYGLTVDHLGCPVIFPPVSISVLASPTITFTPQQLPGTSDIIKCGTEPVVLTGIVSGSGVGGVEWWRNDNTLVGTTNSLTVSNTTPTSYQFNLLPLQPGCTNLVQRQISVLGLETPIAQLTANSGQGYRVVDLQANKSVDYQADQFLVQWYRNGQPFDAVTPITATYGQTTLKASLPVSASGVYTARVTVLGSSVNPLAGCTGPVSNSVSISALPEETYTPLDFTYSVSGLTLTLMPNQSLTNPFYFVIGYPTANAATRITSPYTFTQAGSYRIEVFGDNQAGQSASVTKWVNVSTCPVLSFSISPAMSEGKALLSCSNNPLTLSVTSGLTSYTWTGGGGTGSNSYTYTLPNVTDELYRVGEYRVEATDNNGCRYTSAKVIVRPNNLPVSNSLSVIYPGSIYNTSVEPQYGQFAYLRTYTSGSRPVSLTILPGLIGTTRPWLGNSGVWEGKVIPTKPTTYSLVSAQNECGTVTFSPAQTATVTVRSSDVSLTMQASRTAVSVGEDVVFTITLANERGYTSTTTDVLVLLPAGLSFVGSATLQVVNGRVMCKPQFYVSGSGQTGISETLILDPGSSVPLSFTARAIANGNATVQAQVGCVNEVCGNVWDIDSQPNSGYTDGQDDAASVRVTIGTCSPMISVKTGNWTDPTVWSCGRIPAAGDVVTVAPGHIVSIGAGVVGSCKTIQQQRELVFGTGGRLRLE